MDITPGAVLAVFMRWLHISSVVALLGSFIFARFVIAPAMVGLSTEDAADFAGRVVERFRPLLYIILTTVLVTGLYNYLTKAVYPPHYHAVIGVKFLLVLHIFATSIMYSMPSKDEAKRLRRLMSMVASGLFIVLISAELRWMTQAALK